MWTVPELFSWDAAREHVDRPRTEETRANTQASDRVRGHENRLQQRDLKLVDSPLKIYATVYPGNQNLRRPEVKVGNL